MEKKNILFLSPLTPVGGIASWTMNMLEYIQKNNIQNVYHIDASIKYKTPNNAFHPFYRMISGVMDTVRIIYLLSAGCLKYNPRVVHIATPASFSLFKDSLFLFITKIFRARCIFHYRFGRIPELSEIKKWEWKLLCFNINHSYKTIVIDEPSFRTLCENSFKDKVRLIGNPCSPTVRELAAMEVCKKQKNHFLFVGHVIRNKGIYELLSAFADLNNDIHLTIVGPYNENMKNELISIAQKRKGNWISFLGNQPSDVVIEYMKTAEALILPSYTEGFPNVVLEAMAAGCPVLATSVGAIADMIDAGSEEAAGICFEKKSVSAIIDTLNNFIDTDNHLDYAIHGKNKVLNNYCMEIIFPQYEKLWYNNKYDEDFGTSN